MNKKVTSYKFTSILFTLFLPVTLVITSCSTSTRQNVLERNKKLVLTMNNQNTWAKDNPLNLNETLLAMKAYAPYHHLYAVSMCFSISNNQSDRVPNPFGCWERAESEKMVEEIVKIIWR